LAKVFDPFFTTKAKGSGLGLATVQTTVLDHRGSIHVESDGSTGASFEVRLPYDGPHVA
jgi:signal transduction histidine kinase